MSEPDSHKKKKKESTSNSSKKKAKREKEDTVHTRSISQSGALDPIHEDEEKELLSQHQNIMGEDNGDDNSEEGSKESIDSEGETSEDNIPMSKRDSKLIMNYLKQIESRMSNDMFVLNDRLSKVELSKNLHEQFSTPHKKKKKKKGLLQSVAESVRKSNWNANTPSTPSSPSSSDDSSTSSDDTEDTSSEEDVTSKKKRKSNKKSKVNANDDKKKQLGSLFKSLDTSTLNASKSDVALTRNVSECKIKIINFELSTVAKAIKQIVEYQEKEHAKVNMAKVLSTSCKAHLRVRHGISAR